MNKDDKSKAREQAFKDIDSKLGKGSIFVLGNNRKPLPIDTISSGSLTLNTALGIGGMPRGRIIEIFGQESSGKTTLALEIAAEGQKAGGHVAFIDAEHSLDMIYAKNLGVKTEELAVSQPGTGEDALEIANILVLSGAFDVIIVDSVAALVPKAELEGDMGDAHMGLQARMMSQAMRKLAAAVHRSGTLLIFINQLREKIGVMFGSPKITTGGKALKFYASIRVEIIRIGALKASSAENAQIIGNKTKARVVKNKCAPPFRDAYFDIIYGKGISKEGELFDMAIKAKVLEKSGSWYSYNEERLGQGKENIRKALEVDEDLCKEIYKKIQATIKK